MEKIQNILNKLNIPNEFYETYGKYKSKIDYTYLDEISKNKNGKLILVTATNPTPLGEGKTTQSIGLSMALNKLNKSSIVALREPSLGPVFGIKGGAIGGGMCTVEPSEDINLHFNGDFHAITSANNLLCAIIDNHIFQGNELNIDPNSICIKRVIDINDRSLRNISIENEKLSYNTGFELTVASELMAICSLSLNLNDLKQKIDNMVVAYNTESNPIFVKDLNCTNAMIALLKNTLNPNLVQTCEKTPALIHLGPFANIAHGCNSLIATKMALKLCDYVVTEAGFGSDLGAEKFFDIKCRMGNLTPDLCVLVTTIKALKYNGGCDIKDIASENLDLLKKGFENLKAHIDNLKQFGMPIIVCLNKFKTDSENEISKVVNYVDNLGIKIEISTAFENGSNGILNLANSVINILDNEKSDFKPLYDLNDTIENKISIIAKRVYGAKNVIFSTKALQKIDTITNLKNSNLPICIAKTPASFTDNPKILGRPTNFDFNIEDIKINNGAGFIVAYAGNILTLPGLAKKSNYENF